MNITVKSKITAPKQPTESECFQLALKGIERLTVEAEKVADVQTTEAATLAAMTLRRRTDKARRFFEEYVGTMNAIAKHTPAIVAATAAYESEVERNVEKIAKILPEINHDESRRLITKYVPMIEARRIRNDANATAEKLAAEKLRLCRELWNLFETTSLAYCGSFQNLLERGRQ